MSEQPTIRRSLGWAVVLSWGQRAITTVFVVILAALLGPEAYGIVAMALVYLAVIELFVEAGFLTTIIQREQLDKAHLDSAFWVNFVWSLVLAGVSFALAGWWADVNDVPELADVIRVMSILVVMEGLIVIQEGYLQRTFAFRKLAVRANAAALLGGLVGVGLALSGAGVWSLVAQQITMALVSLVLLWAVSDWRPGLHFSRTHARDLFGFTSGVFLANVGGFVNRRADALLIGLFFTPTVVGIYRLADRFVDSVLELTMRPVGLVSLPHMSVLQRDRGALRDTVAAFTRIAMRTTLPALLVLAACSGYVLAIIGPEWEVGSDALKLLCVVGIVKGLVHFTGPLLFAVAKPFYRATMLWFLAAVSVATVVVVGYALEDASVPRQLTGMSGARALIALVVVVPLNLFIISRVAGLSPRTLARWLPAPLVAGISAIVIVELLTRTGALEAAPPLIALVAAGGLAILVAGTTMLALDPEARKLAQRVLAAPRPSATRTEPRSGKALRMNGRWANVERLELRAGLAESGPVVVGATGGSGTRVLARLLKDGGVFIGSNLNPYEDAVAFGFFSDRWINVVEGIDGEVDRATCTTMRDELRTIVGSDYGELPDGTRRWGWKEPRSIYLLPFFDAAMPSLRFVHFVRDGRDMAFSENQNQLVKHGPAVLRADQAKLRKPAKSIALWSAVNSRAADYGETTMGERYLRVRFEDLCSDPAETARVVYRFLGLPGDPGDAARAVVTPPKTLGRWRDEKPARIRELQEIATPALTRFGYL